MVIAVVLRDEIRNRAVFKRDMTLHNADLGYSEVTESKSHWKCLVKHN